MMKTLIHLLFIAFSGVQAGLLDKWKLEDPNVNFLSENNTFNLSFDLNESVTKDNVRVKIFTSGCQNPEDGSQGIEVTDGITIGNTDVSGGKGTFEFTLDVKTLSKNNDVFLSESPQKASVAICARYMLWTDNGYEVNFIETLLNLNFDLSGTGFRFSGLVSKNSDLSGSEVS